MEITCVGPLEPALNNDQLHRDAWCEGQRVRYDVPRKELVWSQGTCNVFKRIGLNKPPTTQSPIFAKFDGVLCVCVFVDHARILVCSSHGVEWEISLPFSAKQMWRTPGNGLLVERPPHPSLVGEPFLFSISHPLEEPKPVEFSLGQIRKLQQVVWVSETDTAPPLLLTFSINERVHTLWSITTVSAARQREEASGEDEEEEDKIHSEVMLNHVKRIEEWNFKLHRSFLCHDMDKSWVLCAMAQNKVIGFSLLGDSMGNKMFEINNVLDALPVPHSTEQNVVDMLVLKQNNKMELYRAHHLLCPITFISSQRIVSSLDGQDASGGGFDLVFAGDGMRSRVVLNAHVSNEACVCVLRAAKEADNEFGLRVSLNVVAMRRNGADEWDALLSLLDHLLLVASGGGVAAVGKEKEEEESWFDLLMRSSVHAKYKDDGLFDDAVIPPPVAKSIPAVSTVDSFPVSQQTWLRFFSMLHLAYQDLKLNVLVSQLVQPVGELLSGLAQALLQSHCAAAAYRDMYKRDLVGCTPVCFSSTLPIVSADIVVAFPPPDIIDSLRRIVLTGSSSNVEWKWTTQKYVQVFTKLAAGDAALAIEEMVRQNLTLRDIDTLPFGVQTIVREMLHSVRESPPANMSLDMAVLIGRRDSYFSNNQQQLLLPQQQQLQSATSKLDGGGDADSEFKVLQAATKFRFAQDHRIKDVFAMLNGAKLPLVQCERKPGMSDHDLIKVQQVKLHRLISTSLASAVGRGALLLFTRAGIAASAGQSDQPIASSIPALAKSGLVPPQNVSLSLDEHHQFNYSWPAFHNGAAAALSRPSYHSTHKNGDMGALAHRDLTRSWILFNKPKPNNGKDTASSMDTHAGVLLAWGLNRDLAFLSLADTYEHLEQPHELTSIALMLGLGCAKAGTCDVNARKTLTLHVPSLFPAEFNEIDVVPITVQCAAICGLGILYRGTCNRLMCEFLLDEMSQSFPVSDASVEYQASYVLSCGLALGHVALGLGAVTGGLAGLADLEVEDRLHLLIAGGPVMLDQQLSSSQTFDMNDLFSHASAVGGSMGAGTSRHQASARGGSTAMDPKCSRVLEGNHVNTDLTAPGATMALGMIYLKSNDASVANRLSAPSTRFLLENIRPDLLLFRTWARALVMWDEVEATEEWIEAQVPQVLQSDESSDVQDAKYFAQVRTYIMTGAVLGLGFRFAGSANQQAKQCLLRVFSQALLRPNGMLLCCICIALGLVMAGTGDLDALKAIRLFRRTRLACAHFGMSQLASQSMGFLFLGGGRRSFSTTNESIAALVHAVFPRMCSTADDNTQYLQAMRHLYVLASESRVVETFDLDTGAQCFTPLVVTLKTSSEGEEVASLCSNSVPSFGDFTAAPSAALQANQIQLVAPALLPPLHTIESISVVSPRYWPLTVHGFTPRLVVRLRADQLSYERDAHGYSCLQARPRPRAVEDLLGTLRDFSIKSPFVLAFVKHAPASFEQLYQCMLADSLDALPCLLEIGLLNKHREITALEAEQVCLLKQYYSKQPRGCWKRLVSEKHLLLHLPLDSSKLKQYVTMTGDENEAGFYAALNLKGIPKWGMISPSFSVFADPLLSSEAAVEMLDCL